MGEGDKEGEGDGDGDGDGDGEGETLEIVTEQVLLTPSIQLEMVIVFVPEVLNLVEKIAPFPSNGLPPDAYQ